MSDERTPGIKTVASDRSKLSGVVTAIARSSPTKPPRFGTLEGGFDVKVTNPLTKKEHIEHVTEVQHGLKPGSKVVVTSENVPLDETPQGSKH